MMIVVDTEASGPCPMMGDVIQIGAVVAEPGLARSFCTPIMLPLFDAYTQSAYDSIHMTREQHLAATSTVEEGFALFQQWLESLESTDKLTLVSDNPAFDWQWINFGFHTFMGRNPFGHSARRIGDMWYGIKGRIGDQSSWKKLRVTRHTHDPLDDAMGNAEALLRVWNIS